MGKVYFVGEKYSKCIVGGGKMEKYRILSDKSFAEDDEETEIFEEVAVRASQPLQTLVDTDSDCCWF